MLSAGKASQGKHGRGEETNRLSHDAVKLLKTQDAGYLRTVAGRGRRELERLEQAVGVESVLSMGKKHTGKKVVFVDGEDVEQKGKRGRKRKSDEMDQENGMEVEGTGADTNSVGHNGPEVHEQDATDAAMPVKPKSKKALVARQQAMLDLRAARRRRKRLGELRAVKLEALKKRQKEIMAAAEQLELQRAKMSRAVGGVNKDGVKWKIRERKK
jgi:U3 small nucleolar RNA-associated protein 11